ncbi:Polygalacturonase [Phytophthora palmivora]|uniref:endo-polygalacturonase n=1 Tax=Phytophthora palmivora TaxID=4796 RepID=A0A2P4Y6E4_9STRA|nr:Polygalacturonase [Phytophthora palmivora]
MKIFTSALTVLALLVAVANGSPMIRQETEAGDPCNLTGTYQAGTDISSCSTVTVGPLTVPAGVTLDLSKAKDGATINFTGTTTFGTQKWVGPLVSLSGNSLTVKGSGILDGQGDWYWKQGESITRPVFFKVQNVVGSNLSGFTIKNSPFRTFSIVTSQQTTLSGLTLDSSSGNGRAQNTDGFDLTKNDHVTITGCKVYNQDDCLAMQSSTNTIFSNNLCSGSHGISVGSIGGNAVDQSTTVSGLTVQGNTIVNSDNGVRIKALIGMKGLVTNVKYINNQLQNVENAIAIHSDYSRSAGAYTGAATSQVTISDIHVDGLTGSADQVYDIVVNPSAVSGWTFKGINVSGAKGSCKGQPSGITC